MSKSVKFESVRDEGAELISAHEQPQPFYLTVVAKGLDKIYGHKILVGPRKPVYGVRYVVLCGDRKGILYYDTPEMNQQCEADFLSHYICIDGNWALAEKPVLACHDENGNDIEIEVLEGKKSTCIEATECELTTDMDELISALTTIKRACQHYTENGGCDVCPMSEKGDCLVQTNPETWEIRDQAKEVVFR